MRVATTSAPAEPDQAGQTERGLPTQVRLLIAARAVNQLGAFSLAFLTVLLSRDLGAGLATAGAVSAAFGLATIPSRLLGGRLAERCGPRRTILIGLLGCAAAQLGLAAAPDLALAAVFAIVLGLAFELYEPPSQAMIADAVRPADRTAAFALLTTALSVGNMGAGLVADLVGRSNLRWLFVVDAASCLACALLVRCSLEPDAARPRRAGAPKESGSGAGSGTTSPWRDRTLLLVTAGGTVFASIYMLIIVALPLSLAGYGLNPASAGLLMAASTLTLVVVRPVMRIRRIAELPVGSMFAGGYVLMALGLAGFALAHTLPTLLGPTALISIGELLVMGRSLALVSDLAPPGAAARYLAVYGLSWGVATFLAPLLSAWLLAAGGPALLWWVVAGVCVANAPASALVAGLAAGQGCIERA
ncbi:MFS transporter [Actinospica robiniae]|uniref:MFS transporter n=1 Tax=Actinospica robiniae TaxID=304901 RepID=UPI0003FDD369|nr:MFS transporter [Actinospica robiniae]